MISYFKWMRAVSVALLLCLVIGCSNVEVRKNLTAVSGFDTKVTSYPKVVRDYEIIPLEQTEDCILTGIRKVSKVDSAYVIFDNYNNLIVRYDTKGKFLNRIGCKGRASSEYLRIDTFVADEKGRILIFDGSLDKILVYEPDGKYVSSIVFPKRTLGFINAAASVGDDKFLVNNCVFNNFNDIYRILSLNDKKVSRVAGFPMTSENIAEPTGKATIGSYDGKVVFLKPFDDTLYAINERAEVDPVLYVRHSAKDVDDRYYENHVEFSVATTYIEMSQGGYFSGFVSVFETDSYLLLCTYNDIYFLIDKNTYSGQALRLITCEDYAGVPLINVIASSSDGFIGFWRPDSISDESLLELIGDATNDSVTGFVSALNELPKDGTPCLIVYYME